MALGAGFQPYRLPYPSTYLGRRLTCLHELCESLANAGIMVRGFDRYEGSAGPTAVLLNGALFYRMNDIERVPPEVWAYKFRPPVYRGGKGGK